MGLKATLYTLCLTHETKVWLWRCLQVESQLKTHPHRRLGLDPQLFELGPTTITKVK